MSLQSMLRPISPNLSQFASADATELLRELPTETLFLALKEASSDDLIWVMSEAEPQQIQAILDINCWEGTEFQPDQFEYFFKLIALTDPLKIQSYMKELAPELIFRGLREWFEVIDFDPQNPPEVDESVLLLTPDNKYALILKTENPEIRETLHLFMQKYATVDLAHLRYLMEAVKWEGNSELEELGYQQKKGRLEDLGFVDYHEAIALYSVGNSQEYRAHLLANPIDPQQKASYSRKSKSDQSHTIAADEDGEPMSAPELYPLMIVEGYQGESRLSKAIASIEDSDLKDVIFLELIRTTNAALAADKMLNASVEDIHKATQRTRTYIELGLTVTSPTDSSQAMGQVLCTQPLASLFRMGWLLYYDLQSAASKLMRAGKTQLLSRTDRELLQQLGARHLKLDHRIALELQLSSDKNGIPLTVDTISKIARRLTELALLTQTLENELGQALELARPLELNESAFTRLTALILRQLAGLNPTTRHISLEDWRLITQAIDPNMIQSFLPKIANQISEPVRSLFTQRLKEHLDDVVFFIKKNPNGALPDFRFFHALTFEGSH